MTTVPADAANVTFANRSVSVIVDGATVVFHVSEIVNNSKRASGALRLELWAASSPFGEGGTASPPMDFKLAQLQLGPLQSGGEYRTLISPSLPLGTPADGTWYYVLFLTEFTGAATDDGYSVDDWAVMPNAVTIGNPSPPVVPVATAVEYLNAAWGFYFVTASGTEIFALDNGAFGFAWQRTGETFAVWPAFVDGSTATCRFFSDAFAPKSTHFYTPFAAECSGLKASPFWTYEGIAFYMALPDADGLCAIGTVPLYRAYNNGIGGAPNHRYTISFATLQQMLAAGWSFEGNGNTQVFACVPQ
jgi:hypothetical protein